MKRQARIVLAVLLMMFVVLVGQSSAQDNMGRWIVTIQGPAGRAEQAVIRAGGAVNHVYDIIPAIAIRIPAAALPGLKRNPNVVSIEPDTVFSALEQQLPWGIDRIDAELVHSYNTGEGVNVAVLDTGIDYKHPDLATNCAGGINIINPRKDYIDDSGHGTHCAGIIAAENNDIGVVGVAPDASLYGVKVLDRRGRGWLSDILAGLDWCVKNNMDIVNMSLGGGYSSSLETACFNTDAAGIVLVASAGNSGGAVIYPAAYGSVIAVSATNSSDELAGFSNYGDEIELAAPGVSIYSTVPGGYDTKSGTSMAAPHVAGTVALMIANGGYSRETLWSTAEDLGDPDWDLYYGYGLVDAAAAAGVSEGPVTDIAITEIIAPSSVVQGDLVDVSVTVENVGNQNVSNITVTLSSNLITEPIGQQMIDLMEGDSITLTFPWNTTEAALEDHLLGAILNCADDENNDNDYQETTVTVQSALTDIAITAVSAPGSVVEGTQVNVEVTVENIGNQDVSSDIDVTLTVDIDSAIQTISGGLAAGASTTLIYSWNTTGATLGKHTLTASHSFADDNASNDSESTTVTVNEQGAVDEVTITKVEYRLRNGELKVEATSSQGGTAVLTIVGYGEMTYDSKKNKYVFKEKPVADPGETVTVVSSLGGENTAPVKHR